MAYSGYRVALDGASYTYGSFLSWYGNGAAKHIRQESVVDHQGTRAVATERSRNRSPSLSPPLFSRVESNDVLPVRLVPEEIRRNVALKQRDDNCIANSIKHLMLFLSWALQHAWTSHAKQSAKFGQDVRSECADMASLTIQEWRDGGNNQTLYTGQNTIVTQTNVRYHGVR